MPHARFSSDRARRRGCLRPARPTGEMELPGMMTTLQPVVPRTGSQLGEARARTPVPPHRQTRWIPSREHQSPRQTAALSHQSPPRHHPHRIHHPHHQSPRRTAASPPLLRSPPQSQPQIQPRSQPVAAHLRPATAPADRMHSQRSDHSHPAAAVETKPWGPQTESVGISPVVVIRVWHATKQQRVSQS